MSNPIDRAFLRSDAAHNGAGKKREYTSSSEETRIDPRYEYSDAFYEDYMAKFQPNTKKRYGYRFVKRFFDILVSLIALIVLLPFFLIIAIAIKIDSKGPIIFKQKRVGRDGKLFSCYKFRSMETSAPSNRATAMMGTSGQYVTRVGRVLRRFSIDELPQLFCCLIGTMSLIGPRPLIAEEKVCNSMRERMGVFAMRPGLSGYAQVNGRDDVKYKNKPIMDALYVKHASALLDLKLIFQTIGVVITRRGNASEKMEKKKNKNKKKKK